MIIFKQFLKENTQELKLVSFNREPNKYGYTDHFEFSMGKKDFAALENRELGTDWPSAIAVFDLNLPTDVNPRNSMIYQFTNPLPGSSKPLYDNLHKEAGKRQNIMRWILGQPANYIVKKQIKEYTEYIKTIIEFMEKYDLKRREFEIADLDKETKDTWRDIVPGL